MSTIDITRGVKPVYPSPRLISFSPPMMPTPCLTLSIFTSPTLPSLRITSLTLTLIHSVSNWTHWTTLRRHLCLSRAATSASSQVNPIFHMSLLTVLLQFTLGRPGPLLYPGTCQYSACCGMHLWSIRKTCPSQRSRLSLSMLSMVCCPVLVLTSTFVILSFHGMPSILLCHL